MLKNKIYDSDVFSPIYKEWVIMKADQSLNVEPVHITDVISEQSPGGSHDFYSNADYWWPNPETSDGLPYVKRDGESNPNAFLSHRKIMRSMRTHVANMAAGYMLTQEEKYAEKAVQFLKGFFLDEETKLNPHLLYAQAIPGICTGRGVGIIDTLHLIDVPMAIRAIENSQALTQEIKQGSEQWFADYLTWIRTHPQGIEEMNAENNHSVCWYVQAASFALFTNNTDVLDYCREQYKSVLLPNQMKGNGSFPRELARTKPYGYSIFVLDNMVTLCHILSTPEDNLWEYQLEDGRGIQKGVEFLFPYMEDKSTWPYAKDIEHYEGWPARVSFLLFAGLALDKAPLVDLWKSMEMEVTDLEVRRNIAIRQPFLWLK